MLAINIEWRRIFKWAVVLAVIAVAAHTSRLAYARFKAKETRVGGPIPYTVMLRETVHRPDGEATIVEESILAVRSDGAIVRRTAHTNGDKVSEKHIQFASGIEVTINELANLKSTVLEKDVNPARWQRDPSSKCVNSFAGAPMTTLSEVVHGEEMVGGYRTVRITVNNVTQWFALDHGCAMVKDRADWGDQGFSEHHLVALIPGEPDAALFQIPEASKEAPPSERMLNAVKDSAGRLEKCGPKCTEILRKLDARYYSRQP